MDYNRFYSDNQYPHSYFPHSSQQQVLAPPPPYNPNHNMTYLNPQPILIQQQRQEPNLQQPKQHVIHLHYNQTPPYCQNRNEEHGHSDALIRNSSNRIYRYESNSVSFCLWLLIIFGIFFCFIFGFIALGFALFACIKESSGNYEPAYKLARYAKIFAILAIVTGIAIIILNFILPLTVPNEWDWGKKFD